ncbi:cuticle protein 16.5-like [Belonocnema kinseyi]|uniref:cuticle protein 16.5-like n=1 Tax=Belonocnema kinseyi TaxID=2817044 RepID=UPI00143DAED0|nr:cuticle protein 16.5-like [Belonocnema kinseyi]
MVFKFTVLSVLVAVANAGNIAAPLNYPAPVGAPLAYSTGFAAPVVKTLSAGPAVYSGLVPQYAQYAAYAAAPVVKAPVAYAANPVAYASAPLAYASAPHYGYAGAPLTAPLGYHAKIAAPLQYSAPVYG